IEDQSGAGGDDLAAGQRTDAESPVGLGNLAVVEVRVDQAAGETAVDAQVRLVTGDDEIVGILAGDDDAALAVDGDGVEAGDEAAGGWLVEEGRRRAGIGRI